MGKFKEERKQGPPAYMVSFGDMMTLILTFFILLVSLSVDRKVGLMAKGLGSFPKWKQTRIVQILAIGVAIDHGAAEP